MTKRALEIGPDGMANVLVLSNPIPRALSVVSWGANDEPAVSWKSAVSGEFKSADEAHVVLRSPPSADVIKVDEITQDSVTNFAAETLSALRATIEQVLSTPLNPSDRATRVQALHSQAGARMAAFAAAISATKLKTAVRTYKSADLKLPEAPTQSTLNGELDRRAFLSGLEQASAFLTDRTLSSIKDPGSFKTATAAILAAFGQAGHALAQWAAAMPAGVVGVPQEPATTENAGARQVADVATARRIIDLMRGVLGEPPSPTTTEKQIMLTITMLAALADQDPKGFWDVASKAFSDLSPEDRLSVSKKFEWGENGVTPHDPSGILGQIPGIQGDQPILGMILSAVTGIDVNRVAQDNVQVASMRSAPTATVRSEAQAKFEAQIRTGLMNQVAKELESNPGGPLALEVKKLVAPDVAEAVKQAIQHVVTTINASGDEPSNDATWGFQVPESEMESALKTAVPSFNNYRE